MLTINDNFTLFVKNMESSIDFYQTRLGLHMHALSRDEGYKVFMKNDKNENSICLIESNDILPREIYIKSNNIAKTHAMHSDIINHLDPKEAHYTFVDLDGNSIHVCSDFEHIIMPVITKEADSSADEPVDDIENLEDID